MRMTYFMLIEIKVSVIALHIFIKETDKNYY